MSVIWSGVTEEGAVVPVQVTDEGKVVAVGDGPQGDYLPLTGGNLTGDLTLDTDKITLNTDGSATFANTQAEITSGGVITGTRFKTTGDARDGKEIGWSANTSRGVEITRNLLDNAGNTGQSLIRGYATLNDNPAFEFKTDGSAEFAGDVNGLFFQSTRTAGTLTCFEGILNDGSAQQTSIIRADGSATFAGGCGFGGTVDIGSYNLGGGTTNGVRLSGGAATGQILLSTTATGGQIIAEFGQNITLSADGSANLPGNVIIGSRGERWLIRESNGVAMLVQQSREAAPMIPEKVRDIPAELDLIEMALNEVMEKLRMTPPAGWPVWDGSDNP